MKKFSPVGCCIDKRQKSRGTIKIRFTGWTKKNLCFQYRLCLPLASLIATQRLLMDLSIFVNTAWGRRFHCSTRAPSRSLNVWGGLTCWRTWPPSSSQILSIRLRSGLGEGQSRTSTSAFLRKSCVRNAVCGLALWCWNLSPGPCLCIKGNFWSSCESYFDGTPTFLTFINTTTYPWEFFHISTNIQMFCGLNAKKKNHCLISNNENLVAKIQSVKFTFLLSETPGPCNSIIF